MKTRFTTRHSEQPLDRRQFLERTAAAGTAAAGAAIFPQFGDGWLLPELLSNYPAFSWKTVPTAVDVGDSSRTWTPDEASFLADHFSLISIEKSHGIGELPPGARFTETGFRADAAQLKQFNPRTKVLFYWNALRYSPAYEAAQQVRPEWLQPDPTFPQFTNFDLNNPECRRWWVSVATQLASEPNVDGVFVDTLATARLSFAAGAPALLDALRTALNRIRGRHRLILYNIGASDMFDDNGRMDPLLRVADGVFNEDFDRPDAGTTSPDKRKRQLLEMWAAARAGKIVVLKGWPRFTFLWEYARTATYAEKVAKTRAEITFPLAAFLVAAQRHTYFHYSWGYNMADPTPNQQGQIPPDAGAIIESSQNSGIVDRTWYPELLRPLGPPLGPPNIDGYVCTRRFVHADVWVDLRTREARIDWRS